MRLNKLSSEFIQVSILIETIEDQVVEARNYSGLKSGKRTAH